MRLNPNIASLNVYRNYKKDLKNQSVAMSRISSGLKIRKAGDNPYGIGQSEINRLQVRGLQMAARNVQDGVSMLQTAESGMNSITSSVQRIRELLVQGGGITTDGDKEVVKLEINEMIKNVDQLANDTEFNDKKFLNEEGTINMPVGTGIGESVQIPKFDLTASGLEIENIDLSDIDGSLQKIDSAIDKILSARSKYGALENRFESNHNNLVEMADRTQGAESSIREADIAKEMMEYSKNSILVDAGNAMMAQTNQFPKDMLRILENVRSR